MPCLPILITNTKISKVSYSFYSISSYFIITNGRQLWFVSCEWNAETIDLAQLSCHWKPNGTLIIDEACTIPVTEGSWLVVSPHLVSGIIGNGKRVRRNEGNRRRKERIESGSREDRKGSWVRVSLPFQEESQKRLKKEKYFFLLMDLAITSFFVYGQCDIIWRTARSLVQACWGNSYSLSISSL